MNQKQPSTTIMALAIALAVLAGVIMTVATISEQAYATTQGEVIQNCMDNVRPILGNQIAAQTCAPHRNF
jgi:uncharacterized membrane protein SpoIIM required for sporulation